MHRSYDHDDQRYLLGTRRRQRGTRGAAATNLRPRARWLGVDAPRQCSLRPIGTIDVLTGGLELLLAHGQPGIDAGRLTLALFRPFCSNSENRDFVRRKSGSGDDGSFLNVST